MAEELLVHRLFDAACTAYGSKTAVLSKTPTGWDTLTYGRLRVMSERIAGSLAGRLKIGKGEKCALCLENRPEWPALYLGMCRAGITCVPLDTQYGREELSQFCSDSRCRFIFCSRKTYTEKIRGGFPAEAVVLDMPGKSTGWLPFAELLEKNLGPLPTVTASDIASLLYTSGTTGKPKGVMLSHRNLCSNALSLKKTGLCGPDDLVLSILPLYHAYPFMVALFLPLTCGAAVAFSGAALKPEELADDVKDASVSIFVGVPQLYDLMHSSIRKRIKVPRFLRVPAFYLMRPWLAGRFGHSLRIFASGGARLDPEAGRELSLLFGVKVIEGYGLTETSPVVTLNPYGKIKFGSVGKAIPGVEIRIDRPGPSGEGEIVIKGPNVMERYYRNEEETARAIRDGWFHSGDLGYIDNEGYLFITGRVKEAIVLASGKTVYPEELEERYSKGPYIKELFVYPGKEKRAGAQTETIHAVIVPDFGYFRAKKESNFREKIRWELQNIASGLPPYKRIMGFTVSKEPLPRTMLRKIKRKEAMEMAGRSPEQAAPSAEVLTDDDRRLLETPQAKEILSGLSRMTGKTVTLYSNLELDLGIDSLTRVQLELELEKCFSLTIPDDAFTGAYTVKDVIGRLIHLMRSPKTGGKPAEAKSWGGILSEEPAPRTLAQVRLRPFFTDRLLTGISLVLLRWIFSLVWFLKTEKDDHLPGKGPRLICANHASYLDGPAIFCSLPYSLALNTYFIGFRGILGLPWIRWAAKPGRLVPIDPDANPVESLKLAALLLRSGKTVCVFPEGERSADGSVFPFKKGVGIILRELQPELLPVFIDSYRAWPRQKRFPRLFIRIRVRFGKSVPYEQLIKEVPEAKDAYAAAAETVRGKVTALRYGEKEHGCKVRGGRTGQPQKSAGSHGTPPGSQVYQRTYHGGAGEEREHGE